MLSLGSLYVLAVLPVAILWGRFWAVLVAIASMLAFNFFFLEPVHTFRLSDRSNWLALAVYLATAIAVSELAARARQRAAEAEQREREEALLGELSVALLQGESLVDELPRIGSATGSVLGVEGATHRARRHAPGEGIELLAGKASRRTARSSRTASDRTASAVRRFLPALASLLAVGLDREELERQALAAEGLRTSDAVKTAILRAVSHDLRSPLTAIRVAAESLTSASLQLSAEDRRRQLETLRVETRRLDRLVTNLLDFSRLEAGAARPRTELVAVDELIGQALAGVDADPVPVEVKLPREIPFVEVDSAQVERALVNLLANAQRFAPMGTPVTVTVSAGDEEVVLRIANNGPAIGLDDLDQVFEPFVRLAGDDDREGSGLGLAIARSFAEANGGRVWAESPPGGGAAFGLAFPMAQVPVEVGG